MYYGHYPLANPETIANRISAHGSGPDTVNARISPLEAQLLGALGGSGRPDMMGRLHFANEGAQGHMGGGGTGGPGGGNAGANGGGGGGGIGGGSGGGDRGGPTGLGIHAGGLVGDMRADPGVGGWGNAFGDTGYSGNRGPLGAGDAPVHTAGLSSPLGGSPYGDYGGVGSAYQGANSSYQNRSFGDRALGFALGLIPGFHYAEAPSPNLPGSWAGGTWHSGFNPGEAIGSLAGFAAPGAGLLGGWLGGEAYNAAFGPDIGLNFGSTNPNAVPQTAFGGWHMGNPLLGHSLNKGDQFAGL